MLAPEFSEMGEYDRLAAELLTPQEYATFLSHRAELAMKDWVKAAATATGVGGLTEGDVTRQAVEKIIRSAPLNGDAIWKDADSHLTRGGQLSEADLAALAATATQHFESALATGAAQLSPEQLRLLRAWFQKAVVDSNLRGLAQKYLSRAVGFA